VRRFVRRLVESGGSGEVALGDLEIVPLSDQFAVAQPGTDQVKGIFRHQFCLATASEIDEELLPRRTSGAADDAEQVRSQVY
jgi:hypothetical protein